MTDLTLAEIEVLEAKARAATPGPWRTCAVDDSDEGYDTVDGVEILFAEGLIADTGSSTCGETEDLANAAHIAAFDPPTALSLCAMAKAKIAAEERVRELEEEVTCREKHYRACQTIYLELLQVTGCNDGGELQEKAERATRAEQERDRLAQGIQDVITTWSKNGEVKLRAGELKAGEMRAVRACLDGMSEHIRYVLASLSAEKGCDAALSEEPAA